MLIDCDTCTVRDVACHDCVVGVLLGTPEVPSRVPDAGGSPGASGVADGAHLRRPDGPLPLEFGPVEQRALEVLADHGLIPRLRLVPPSPSAAASGGPPPGRAGTTRPGRARDAG